MSTQPVTRFTVHVPQALGERLMNAAVGTGISVAEFLRRGIEIATIAAEAVSNDGEPFPPRPALASRLKAIQPADTFASNAQASRPSSCPVEPATLVFQPICLAIPKRPA
jgi:hypothetical protein